jgi:hypothetical protein
MTKVIVIEEHRAAGVILVVSFDGFNPTEEKSFVAASKEDAFRAADLINDLLGVGSKL